MTSETGVAGGSSLDPAGGPAPGASGAAGTGPAQPQAPWTVLRLIRWSADYLESKGVERGRLDAEHLLAHALGTQRLQLYLEFDRPLEPRELEAFKPLLRRRARREPLQYILGRTAFRELELLTDARALIPRPETEILVQTVLTWAEGRSGLQAVDVGTGTGCVALSLLEEGPFDRVWATDVSADALGLASENARSCGLDDRITWVLADGLSALSSEVRADVIVSNPPYIAESEAGELAPEVLDHEPRGALFGGPDGLEVIRGLVAGAPALLAPGGLLALEVGAGQGPAVLSLLEAGAGWEEAAVHRDLAGRPRVVTAVRSG